MLNRRNFGALVGLAGAAAVLPGRAHAAPEAYPHRTVTLLTHSSPGGGSDVLWQRGSTIENGTRGSKK